MDDLIGILGNRGPLTGKELTMETGMDTFTAWKSCTNSRHIVTCIVGKRYLRLDIKVDGYARLSPSIMREFLNYTIIGLKGQKAAIAARAVQVEKEIATISKRKIELARDTIRRLVENHQERASIINKACFIIAGDVVFDMAHAEPRPEVSTGELVRGSDLDIIIVTEGLPDQLHKSLDSVIYKEKYNLLMNPASKEELDYIIKDLAAVDEQFHFTDFKAMVASKILDEGQYLYGSRSIYNQIRQMLISYQIPEKICLLERKAQRSRIEAERSLLSAGETTDHDQLMALFYTTEEKEEIF